ncbi:MULTISPECIES: site-specific recombinase [unclassified Pasteurella]|uniref:site-specific recombinase n=1 Tax=unclassified Pasteurella TaxID=2621516 RepID=UPI001073F9CC|nr:recombinase [Pasteurella sp. 19428wF3_WM03]TFU53221.1 recombinase [Pasteurella sp. WM03]
MKPETLPQFIRQKVAENDAFGLIEGWCQLLRESRVYQIVPHIRLIRRILKQDKELAGLVAALLCNWVCSLRLYPLFISSGILSREGFGREMKSRLYERFNPSFKDVNDLRDIFYLLFNDKNDVHWIDAIPLREWRAIVGVLARQLVEKDRHRLQTHFQNEGLFAIEMLSIWIAAEDMEPELMRMEPSLLNADSPFVALNREVGDWLFARRQGNIFDDSHFQVMFEQCKGLIERLQKRGAQVGSSLNVAYLLERLSQTLERLEKLMAIFASNRYLPRRILLLTGCFARAAADQHSISRLWKQSSKLIARSITQNSSDHGEHYITRDKKEYVSMFYSAAGGGVLIALMALFKIYLGSVIDDKVWKGIAEGLNYGLGFTLIFMLHFTVATKQPAMTAARFAEAVERNPQGKALNMKLAQLLVDVFRSQSIAVVGNVVVAMSLAALIAFIYQHQTGQVLLNQEQIDYQLHSIDPFAGTLWFAAIAGVWLFCSGIISGYFDNRSHYLNTRMRLRQHPGLRKVLPFKYQEKLADYLHENYGSIMGNLCFGLLLGLTGVVGYVSGLPLDIRHVAFSSANVGYIAVSGYFDFVFLLQCIAFVLLIGLVNLIVSFSLTLWLALRSLNTEIDSWWAIWREVGRIVKQRPLSLFFPLQLEK